MIGIDFSRLGEQLSILLSLLSERRQMAGNSGGG
jgi:hypothetical protein